MIEHNKKIETVQIRNVLQCVCVCVVGGTGVSLSLSLYI